MRSLRALGRHPLLLFGLLLLIPAAGFCLLGWRSVLAEASARRRDGEREAASILALEVAREAESLEGIARAEGERPYFEYQPEFVPAQLLADGLALQATPLAARPADPRVLGWFQWERGPRGIPDAPETFGPGSEAWRDALAAAYGPVLRERLAHADGELGLRAAARVDYPLWVVMGNEQRGQLFEELQLVETQRRQEAGAPAPPADRAAPRPPAAPEGPAPQVGQTLSPYLRNFLLLAGDDPVPVRYSPFRWLARAAGEGGPALVAWRLVWIPGAHRERREGAADRWLLQGLALDPDALAAPGWRPVGPTLLCRGDCAAPEALQGAAASRASLLEALDGDLVPGAGAPDAALLWAAAADPSVAGGESRAAVQRFLLLVGGLLAVTGLGFVFLLRGVRRELALARRKEDFLAAVTHELKTPLTGIRMYAEMLREGWTADPAAAGRQAQRILDESDRLAALVNQILDLAALERGVLRANVVRGDLAAAVRAAAESLQARAREAGVALAVEVGEGLPPAPLDERLVRPLVLNLVDNAIKHGGRGEDRRARVTLSHEGGRAVLRVADRGPGLPREVLDHLFEPFRRGEGELTRTTTGVGIGLALVKRYADALGAEVSVESAPGRGTVFAVRFPL